MATKTDTKIETKRGIKLPDLSEFAQQGVNPDAGTPGVGRVEGIDYEAWAVALVDLNDAENRVARNRTRISRKGYRKVDGSPLVGGFDSCEVWVIPRKNYEKNRARRRAKIEAAINNGTMSDGALQTGTITKSK